MNWWENSFLAVENNRLKISGRDAPDLAEEFGTPLFIYSRSQVLANLRKLEKAFCVGSGRELRVCYAMKANYNKELLELLCGEGAWIDAVSPGEVERAVAAGFSTEKIIYTGTSVSRDDLRLLFRTPGIILNIDAEEQLDLMIRLKDSMPGFPLPRVSVRWNPGLGRGFSPKTVTAGARASDGTPIKFGVEESRVEPVLQKAMKAGFTPVGLHQHLGSGWIKKDFGFVTEAVDRMISLAARLQDKGFALEFLDFGGGFGPVYHEGQSPFPLEEYAGHILSRMDDHQISCPAVAVEPGKFLIGDAGILLLQVEYIKSSHGNRFICVNGGTFNTVPRPAIYTQAHHTLVHTGKVRDGAEEIFTVAGNLCETGDVFAKEIALPRPEQGDLLALLVAGAYCRSMASHFNCRPIPREILL